MSRVAEVAYLVKGNDPVLRDKVVDDLVSELLADDDRTLALEDHAVPGRASDGEEGGGGAEAREAVVAAVLNAVSSPPFMTARRIVVVREAGGLTAADAELIGRYLDTPLDTSVLLLVSGGGTIPTALTKKLKEVGAGERAPNSEKTSDVLADAAQAANVQLRPDAVRLVTLHLGEDAGRVGSFVEVLRSAYGDDAILTADEVAPYLGEVGAVPSYQLTNAIEGGDSAGALEVLNRLLNAPNARDAKPMHPLQVLSSLLGYYRRLLRLDDAALQTPADAVAALGGRIKEFPARKALSAARSLGTDGIRQAFDALHQADLDLKGARGIPADAVIEVLVVRLARLSRARGRGAPARRR
jgi:DNA polymerase-3 subunit delta